MVSKTELGGMIVPLVTPLGADGELKLDCMPALVEHVIAGRLQGIFANGSQGEAYALAPDERAAALDAVLVAVNGRVPVLAGTGAITTRQAIALTRQAERAGAAAAIIGTPYFITPSQDELFAYYADIAAAVTLPILGYSNPRRTGGVAIAPATLARLAAQIPHFVGVKESSGDLAKVSAVINACPADFRVFVGGDTLIYATLCYGGDGAIGMTMNIAPSLAASIYSAFQSGDHTRARELQAKMSVLREALSSFGTYPVWIKEALTLMGLPAGPARRPILPLDDSRRTALRDLLVTSGVMPASSP